MWKKIARIVSAIAMLALPAFCLASCGNGNQAIVSLDQLNTSSAKIGIITGSNHGEHINKRLPEAEVVPINTLSDGLGALTAGKIDALAADQPTGRSLMVSHPEISMLPELLENLDYAFAFSQSASSIEICDALDEYLAALKNDGKLEELQSKWFDSPDPTSVESLDYRALPATNGTLRLSLFQNPPFAVLCGSYYGGYEIEIFSMFCKDAGYALTVSDLELSAMLADLSVGRCDTICGGITITDERKETMHFSTPDYSGGTALLVRNVEASSSEKGFFEGIGDSFYKTFVRDSRYLLFLQGIGTTLLITISSILAGILLGFCAFLACRKGNKIANFIAKILTWLIQGMPVVVLLMILYYAVFGKTPISGAAVSVIGFTLVFGSSVFGMLKTGVSTIDKGQMEAAYALGYRDNKAFFRIILPQALPHILPIFKSEVISLIKATAVVGYVSVQDVTKMGDIVRAMTFEPFFPLITVAIIYFLLAALLIFIVNRISFVFDFKKRKRKKLLKGVTRHD